jgi:LysR family glycine cleavage system transcriptional activator
VFHGPPHWPGTISYHLLDEDMVAVASPKLGAGHAIKTAADLAKFPLLHNMGNRARWGEWMAAAGVTLDAPLHGNTYQNYAMIAHAATAGAGIALLPRYLVEDDVAAKRLEIVGSEYASLKTAYHLILPETRASSNAVQSFAKWLIAEAQAFKTTNGRVIDATHRREGEREIPLESLALAPVEADA